jgi:multisubunit Na+/H+ antiporter MnhF subunit
VNFWLAGTLALCGAFIPCAAVCLRAKDPMDRVVALEMAGVLLCLQLVLLAEGMQRPLFLDLALAQALLSFGAALVFAHFLERWV